MFVNPGVVASRRVEERKAELEFAFVTSKQVAEKHIATTWICTVIVILDFQPRDLDGVGALWRRFLRSL